MRSFISEDDIEQAICNRLLSQNTDGDALSVTPA